MRQHTNLDIPRTNASALARGELLAVGIGSGLLGGIALVIPVVLWDWVRSGHLAFELPMAATAWVFGLQYFSNTQYLAWPLVVGLALLAGYSALSGLVFTGLADRVFALTRLLASLAGGVAWSVVSFLFFWDMLLPIVRDGAPLRVTPAAELFVASNWVWVLGFVLMGLVTGVAYALLRPSAPTAEVRETRTEMTPTPLPRAA
jgi:hypothetical protein